MCGVAYLKLDKRVFHKCLQDENHNNNLIRKKKLVSSGLFIKYLFLKKIILHKIITLHVNSNCLHSFSLLPRHNSPYNLLNIRDSAFSWSSVKKSALWRINRTSFVSPTPHTQLAVPFLRWTYANFAQENHHSKINRRPLLPDDFAFVYQVVVTFHSITNSAWPYYEEIYARDISIIARLKSPQKNFEDLFCISKWYS